MAKKVFYKKSELVFREKPNDYRFIDMTGTKFGRLTVLGYACTVNRQSKWYCECECGNITKVFRSSLISGITVSCSCYAAERAKKVNTAHGLSSQRIYKTWVQIRQRCQNPKNPNFDSYGGRGIKVSDSWQNFKNFHRDMGDAPPGLSVDRIDNNGDYCVENCRWATVTEQANNRKVTKVINFNGKSQGLMEWAREVNIPGTTIRGRINKGWSIERALTTRPMFLKK